MVLEGVEWDKKEFPESNLHVCGRDDTKIVVYSMRRWPKEKDEEIFVIILRALVTLFKKKTL